MRFIDIYFTHPLRAVIYQICTQSSLPYDYDEISGESEPWQLIYYEKEMSKGNVLNLSSSLRGQGIIYSDTGFFELAESSKKGN